MPIIPEFLYSIEHRNESKVNSESSLHTTSTSILLDVTTAADLEATVFLNRAGQETEVTTEPFSNNRTTTEGNLKGF